MKVCGRAPICYGLVLLSILAAGCSSSPPAPVVERSDASRRLETPVDGLYRVRRGDSLHAIAFQFGLDWRDLAAWNGIRVPYTIYPDQVLRLKAPARVARQQPVPRQPEAQRPATPPARKESEPVAAAKPVPPTGGDPVQWAWPVEGRVLRAFKPGDPGRNGLDIAGREGQAVRAAASGDVVYSGNGLIGYGELVIVKHSESLLSAYAHNRRRLVDEGEAVRQGQKIAELGRNDRNEQILHFEIRLRGKPVDPLNYLQKQ